MPPIGASNAVKLSFINEVTPGTTPNNPAMQDLRFLSETLNLGNTTVQSEEIRNDRGVPDLIVVGRSIGGDVNCELSGGTYDTIMHNGLFADAAWTTLNMAAITIAATVAGFTDSGNGFVTAGIQAGQFIKVGGFGTSSINTFYRVLTVAAGTITTFPAPAATAVAGASVTIKGSTATSGKTDRPFTMQKQFPDLTAPVYQNFRGCRVGSMKFGMSSESKMTFGFSVMGMSGESVTTQISGRTETAKTTTNIMNASTNAFDIVASSTTMTTTLKFTEISLNFDNTLRELDAIGVLGAVDIRPGTINAVATINPYFEDVQALTAFNNSESIFISWRCTSNDGYTYIFSLPNCKFTSQNLAAGGRNTDMIIQAQVQALVHPTLGYTMRIDKFNNP
jgi:hypothetical protein